jgi:predicted N-acetyltransferase YhbS
MISYQIENELSTADFRKVLISSKLGERRPVDDIPRLEKMLKGANLILTARINNEIIGIARSVSDFAYCTYLSDLAVDVRYQKMGIGRELIRLSKIESGQARLILLSAPAATSYYPRIGMKRHEQCFYIDSIEELL